MLISLALTLSLNTQAANPAQKVFNTLSKLSGVWEGTYSNGNSHRVSYKLISNGTVLVETWTMSPTRESMTLYTLDGDRLLANHLCPQGNQPRLILKEKDKDNRFQFKFLDGTNLQDRDGSHQHAFWLKVESSESFSRSETYVSNAQTDFTNMKEGETVFYRRTAKSKL